MVIENSTRRLAIVAAFIPLMALYLIYTFKLHFLLPSIATWPTQQQIAVDVSTFMRHKLFPWTVKVDMLREGLENSAHRTRFTSHIVAVGDLHGDMGNAKKVLQFAGVVDGRGRWTGDVDVLVQTGDIIDRYGISFCTRESCYAEQLIVEGTILSLYSLGWINCVTKLIMSEVSSCPCSETMSG